MIDRELSQPEKVMHLRLFSGFRDVSPERLAALAEHATQRSYRAGEEIQAEGQPVRELVFVIAGEAALRRNGQELRRLPSPAAVGSLAAFAGRKDGPQAVALTEITALTLSRQDQIDVFEDNFEIARSVLGAVARANISQRKQAGPDARFSPEVASVPAPHRPLSLIERLALLRGSMAFSTTSISVLAEFARDTPERRYRAGERLWTEGDEAGTFVLIVSGVIAGEREHQQFRFGPGSVVGSLSGLARQPRWFSAVAETDVVGLELKTASLLDMFEDDVDLLMDLLGAIANLTLSLMEAAQIEQ